MGAIFPFVDARAVTAGARDGLHSAVGVVAVLAMIVMRKGVPRHTSGCETSRVEA